VKKKKPDVVENVMADENQTNDVMSAGISGDKNIVETGNFCVYIGPSIRGVIQSGTIYPGSLEKTKEFLAPAIQKYPLIGKLISTDKTIAEDRIKVNTAGNLLNVYCRQLAGKSK
jgi:hypothetical protein